MAAALDGRDSTERQRAEGGLRRLEVAAKAGNVDEFLRVCGELGLRVQINTDHPAFVSGADLDRIAPCRVGGVPHVRRVTVLLPGLPCTHRQATAHWCASVSLRWRHEWRYRRPQQERSLL
ncbi:unnamed protein product [Ectocarpus sp. 13 AM-2016]